MVVHLDYVFRTSGLKFGQFISNFNFDVQHLVRKLERHNKKLNRQISSVVFNKTCLLMVCVSVLCACVPVLFARTRVCVHHST